MAIIVVRVELDDPDGWYADHMAALGDLRHAGVVSGVMYRDRNQPNARVGILEVEDVDRFFSFHRDYVGSAERPDDLGSHRSDGRAAGRVRRNRFSGVPRHPDLSEHSADPTEHRNVQLRTVSCLDRCSMDSELTPQCSTANRTFNHLY
jgi:hypothetical protein